MKERCFRVIRIYVLLLIILVVYYFVNMHTGFYIPCIFREVTGFKCPGCGITHLIFDLINFKIKDAFYDNPLVFIYLPFIVAYFIYQSYLYVHNKRDKLLTKIPSIYLTILIIITLLYGVLRNIYNF